MAESIHPSRSRDPADYQGQVLCGGVRDGVLQDLSWPWPFLWRWGQDFVGIVALLPSLPPRYLSGCLGKIPRAVVVARGRLTVLALLVGVAS